MDYDKITAMIRLIQIADRQFTTCPEMTIDPQKQYLATFKTSQGDFTAQLYADKAPVTVNAFVFLAREGWYNNISFHRVIPDFIVQSGDPTGTGYGGPGFAYINEISDLTFDRPGMLAMANSGADTNGSQFFITYVPLEQLNGDYTIFGQVIEGMDVVEKLTPRDPENSANPPPGDTLIEVIITEN
ncbi:MAG TPA: peptidylprolyl isomerase [Anaerolineaceae bacterium]